MSSVSVPIILDDSSDEDSSMEGKPSVVSHTPLEVSSLDDEDGAGFSSSSPTPRVSSDLLAARSFPTKPRTGLNYNSESAGDSSDEGEEDDAEDDDVQFVPSGKQKSGSGVKTQTSAGDAFNDTPVQLPSRRANGRMFSDAFSFRDLQAQQMEFARLQGQRKYNSRTSRGLKAAARSPVRRPATAATAAGTKRKARDAVTSGDSPHRPTDSKVCKKTATRGPFEVDSPSPSEDSWSEEDSLSSSSSEKEKRAQEVLLSLTERMAKERELAEKHRAKDHKAHSRASAKAPKHKKQKKTALAFKFGSQMRHSDSSEGSSSEILDQEADSDDSIRVKTKQAKSKAAKPQSSKSKSAKSTLIKSKPATSKSAPSKSKKACSQRELSWPEPDEEENNEEKSDEEYAPAQPKRAKTAAPRSRSPSAAKAKPSKTARNRRAAHTKKQTAAQSASNDKAKKSGGRANSCMSKMAAPSAPSVADAPVSDTLTHRRTARDTVMHTTTWRDVRLDVAPPNVLPLEPSVALPFHSECDRPLLTYDEGGDLWSKCKFVPSFGKTSTSLMPIALVDVSGLVESQEDVNKRVMKVIERELPKIRACYTRKTAAIIKETRAKVSEYLAAHKKRMETTNYLGEPKMPEEDFLPQLNPHSVGVSRLEKTLLKQMKQSEKLVRAGGLKLKYTVGQGESSTFEKPFYPRDVYRLSNIRPLSRSTTFVGLKSNVRVEDDPILRYMPYFGDNDDGGDIDVAQYDGVRAKEKSQYSGLDGEVNEYLLRLVVRKCGDSDKVFNALKTVLGFAQAYTDYSEIKKTNDSMQVAARRIKEAKSLIQSEPFEFPLAKLAASEPQLSDRVESETSLEGRFAPPSTFFDSNLMRCHADRCYGLGLRPTNNYADLSITYRDMFCRMCYVYDCPEHGIEHPLPSRRVDPINPPVFLSPVALAAKNEKLEEGHSDQTPEGVSPIVSPPVDSEASRDATDAQHENDENDEKEEEDVIVLDTPENDPPTDEEASVTVDEHETRRSSRSLTRISTMASRNLTQQATWPSQRKPSRTRRVKSVPRVADESEYLDDSHHVRVTAIVKQSLTAHENYSSECWKTASPAAMPGEEESDSSSELVNLTSALSETELVLLQKLRYVIGDNPYFIASMIKSTSCKEIRAFLESERLNKPVRTGSMDEAAFSPDARSKNSSRKRVRSRPSRSTSNRVLLKRTMNNRLKENGSNHEYEPCNHEGVCDTTTGCACMTRDHMCEKACSCSRDCPNRFPGCKCTRGNCRTKACPCFVAARECDPDVCFTCGASEAPVLLFDEKLKTASALDLGICCNVSVLRGLHKKVGVAFSITHGWGAFAREPIKRGEFIYEYHGALLSQDEAERRGSIYDKMTISFLFDANEDSVVDAIRKGNKSKFANHSNVGQKCKGKVLVVGGEHRISIWAQQDIKKGEELFFDYGYHGDSAPDWSQLRIKGSARQSSTKKDEDEEWKEN